MVEAVEMVAADDETAYLVPGVAGLIVVVVAAVG